MAQNSVVPPARPLDILEQNRQLIVENANLLSAMLHAIALMENDGFHRAYQALVEAASARGVCVIH